MVLLALSYVDISSRCLILLSCLTLSNANTAYVNSLQKQLINLAVLLEVAYEELRREEYVLTNLSNVFDHLGLKEKAQGLSVSVGPTYAFSYLHRALQEYLAALHIDNTSFCKLESKRLECHL